MARSKQMAKQRQTQQQLIAGYGRRKPEDVLLAQGEAVAEAGVDRTEHGQRRLKRVYPGLGFRPNHERNHIPDR